MQKLHEPVHVPGPIAIALMTGRPELARVGMMPLIEEAKGTPYEALAEALVTFAAGCVRDIQTERDTFAVLAPALEAAEQNLVGSLNAVRRLSDAVRMMMAGQDPEAIREALKSNNELLRERKASARMAEEDRPITTNFRRQPK